MKKALIFDLDGTLLDSMSAWDEVALEYLKLKDISNIPPDMLETFRAMSVLDCAKYFIAEFGVEQPLQQICDEINKIVEEKYKHEIKPKEGVQEFLLKYKDRKMCIATATERHLVEIVLQRHGLDQYFEFIITSADVGCGKDRPDIFLKAADRLGFKVADCIVFEDAAHAIKAAKRVGFYTVGVYEKCFENDQEVLKKYADQYVSNLNEAVL